MRSQKILIGVAIGTLLLTSVMTLPALAQNRLRDQEPGSLLIFPAFTRDATTQLCITDVQDGQLSNGGPPGGAVSAATLATWIRINFVCGGVKGPDQTCRGLDVHFPITHHGTRCINLNTEPTFTPPCTNGFAVAFAEDVNFVPVSHNFLIGHSVISGPGFRAEDNAIAVQSSHPAGTLLGDKTSGTSLTFGPVVAPAVAPAVANDYAALPDTLHGTFRAADAVAGFDPRLILFSLDSIAGAQNATSLVFIDFWSANEIPFSTSREFVCWDFVPLANINSHFTAAGLTTADGSLRVTAQSNCPIPGGCPPLFPNAPTILGAFVDVGPGSAVSMRNLFHTGARSTTFFPR